MTISTLDAEKLEDKILETLVGSVVITTEMAPWACILDNFAHVLIEPPGGSRLYIIHLRSALSGKSLGFHKPWKVAKIPPIAVTQPPSK